MGLFTEIFSWWGGNTIGTRFFTWKSGRLIGEDEFGNRYYEQAKGVGPLDRPRRWVTYATSSEATQVPPGWYGWLHYTADEPPQKGDYENREWQLGHQPNMTGTPQAYRPQGSVLSEAERPRVSGDYEPWRP